MCTNIKTKKTKFLYALDVKAAVGFVNLYRFVIRIT